MKSFLWKIYTYTFLDHFILIYPVYTLLFKANGLTDFQIATLFAIWAGITVLLEVPTGVLADKYSRRNILIFAQTLKGVGYILWLVGANYLFYALGFILWGIAGTLVSGTFESFIYDELKAHKQASKYERINGIIAGTRFVGITFAVVLGGFVADIGFTYALIPSILIPFAAGAMLLTIRSVKSTISTGERGYWKVLGSAINEAKHSPQILRLMAFMAIVFGVVGASDEFWALFFNDIGISLTVIGIIFAAANATSAAGSYTAHWWPLPGKRIYGYLLISSLFILAIAFLQTKWSILLSFIAYYMIEVTRVKFEARLQHSIKSHQRATVSSINSLLLEIIAMAVYFTVGLLSRQYGIVSFLWLFGITVGVLCLLFLLLQSSKQRRLRVAI